MIDVPNYGTIPEAYEKAKPDFVEIGSQIDACLRKHFRRESVVIRVLGSDEHPAKTVDELIRAIKIIGHDRYGRRRDGNPIEGVDNGEIDFFGLPLTVTKTGAYFRWLLESFFYWPIISRGRPVRIEIAIIYDPEKLSVVEYRQAGRAHELKLDGFVFKDPLRKPAAIRGIVKIKLS